MVGPFEIKPTNGINNIIFGMKITQVRKILGEPERNYVDDEGDKVFEYPRAGVNWISFDSTYAFKLMAIEINKKSDAILFDTNIFEQSQEEIQNLFKSKNLSFNQDNMWDQKANQLLFECNSLGISFYFNILGELEEIVLGVVFNENDEVIWPDRE